MRGENAEVDNVDGAVGVQVAVPRSGRGLPEMGLKDPLDPLSPHTRRC